MAETLLLQAGAMFAGVGVASLAADRLGVSPIPLYVLAGMVLNEHVAGRTGVFVVEDMVSNPDADFELDAGDLLVTVGTRDDQNELEKLLE